MNTEAHLVAGRLPIGDYKRPATKGSAVEVANLPRFACYFLASLFGKYDMYLL